MPKMKTHRGAARRMKRTGTGLVKIVHSHANHIFTKKSRKRKRNLRKGGLASPADMRRLKRLLPL
ncbi:MAG: 50S ribosomal protein L35 [Candidatus Fermentibacter sp.]|jgi:large subunit ribosomal protein L35|nr:50S ribosomal protein L35 [Candidatus Fermentibacter sp.]